MLTEILEILYLEIEMVIEKHFERGSDGCDDKLPRVDSTSSEFDSNKMREALVSIDTLSCELGV